MTVEVVLCAKSISEADGQHVVKYILRNSNDELFEKSGHARCTMYLCLLLT